MKGLPDMSDDDLLRLDNQLCFSIYAASKEIIRRYRPLLESLDLTYTQYLVLMVLWETSPIPFQQLSDRLLLDSGTLSPVLKKMEKKDLVIRTRLQDDERQIMLALTLKAIQLREKAIQIPKKLSCMLHLDLQQAKVIRDALHQLVAGLPKG